MRRIIIESPYAGRPGYPADVEQNVKFAENVCRLVTRMGHAPLASHLIYTRFLDDNDPHERKLGIMAGLAWAAQADEAWICLKEDAHPSPGMILAMNVHQQNKTPMLLCRFSNDGSVMIDAEEIADSFSNGQHSLT